MADIVALTKELLGEAIILVDKIFPPEYEEEPAKDEIAASLFPEKYEKYFNKTGIRPSLKYWVAISKGKVVGIVGLYNYVFDLADITWLGWYLVSPKARKHGTGTSLLLFAIEEAKRQGKKRLMVYTTDDPEELYSHHFYRKHGFREIGQNPWGPNPELTEFYFELDLMKAQAE
ncbi:MAG: GNAT family N-acetyltransferase [bacterium]|nr:GNAT family N-acetyltransferase [bacterium]